MSLAVTVAAMTEADLDEVVAIERVSHGTPKGRDSFESDLENEVARCLVLRGDGRVLGYLVVWVTDVVEVIDVAVAPEWRGRRLVDRLLAEALRMGSRVLLEVRAGNVSAIKVYLRHGFERVGVRRGYYGDGEDAVLMARDGVEVAAASWVKRERAAVVRGLYPILSDDVFAVRDFAAAAAVLAPHVSVMQLRFKDSPDAVALGVAREVVAALSGWPGLLVINDRADLLRLVAIRRGPGEARLPANGIRREAKPTQRMMMSPEKPEAGPFFGLHLGQTDLPLEVARQLMPVDAVLGYSTHDLGQLSAALRSNEGVAPDYVAFGPVFATGTKKNPDPVVGLDGLVAARRLLDELGEQGPRPPLVAIGGLDAERAGLALQHCDAVAVIGALLGGGLAELEGRLSRFISTLGARA